MDLWAIKSIEHHSAYLPQTIIKHKSYLAIYALLVLRLELCTLPPPWPKGQCCSLLFVADVRCGWLRIVRWPFDLSKGMPKCEQDMAGPVSCYGQPSLCRHVRTQSNNWYLKNMAIKRQSLRWNMLGLHAGYWARMVVWPSRHNEKRVISFRLEKRNNYYSSRPFRV